MSKSQIISCLDIGTANVRLAVAKQVEDNRIQVLGVGESPCSGLRKGVIIDIDETVKSIEEALAQAERASATEIKKVFLGIDGSHLSAQTSKGTVVVSRADQEVTNEDVVRAIEAAEAITFPPNREFIKSLPKAFILDGQNSIKFPIGMNGVRLEVEVLIIEGSSLAIKNLKKTLEKTGLKIEGLILSPLASARAVLNKRQKELGVALIDIGAGTTGLCVYEEGAILHTAVLPIGGSHITNDIAIGLKSDIDLAEAVKIKYNNLKTDTLDFSKIDSTQEGKASNQEIEEIIEARLSEIFALVNKELKQIDRERLLPAGVVITGGVAKTKGIIEIAKKVVELPAQIGKPVKLDGVGDLDDPKMASIVGLILLGLEDRTANPSPVNNWKEKAKDIFRKFLP